MFFDSLEEWAEYSSVVAKKKKICVCSIPSNRAPGMLESMHVLGSKEEAHNFIQTRVGPLSIKKSSLHAEWTPSEQ